LVVVEIDNPDDHGMGEVVVTSLLGRRQPVIRYVNGDVGSLENVGCACGCAWPLLRFFRRTTETVFIGGAKLSADQIEVILERLHCTAPYQLVVTQTRGVHCLDFQFAEDSPPVSPKELAQQLAIENVAVYAKIVSGQIELAVSASRSPADQAHVRDKRPRIIEN
jgi:phenylacetate-coenzyme A ligase PaaK-like adenylate-forming protein